MTKKAISEIEALFKNYKDAGHELIGSLQKLADMMTDE